MTPASAVTPLTPQQNKRRRAIWQGLHLVVVDTETTGVVNTSRVISLALLEVSGGIIRRTSSWLVNPGLKRIGATSVHGMSAEDLVGERPFNDIAAEVLSLLSMAPGAPNLLVVGHNVAFDLRMLHGEFAQLGTTLPAIRMLDTADLAPAAKLVVANGTLTALLNALDLVNPAEHSALGDAFLTATAAVALIDMLGDQGVTTLDDHVVTFDPAISTAAQRGGASWEPQILTPNHKEAHAADLADSAKRLIALDICIAEKCTDLIRRMEDAVICSDDTQEMTSWALAHITSGALDRRLTGRLLVGLGRVIRLAENPELARSTYVSLVPTLTAFGECASEDKCGRCMYTERLCRFEQVRHLLIAAFLYEGAERRAKASVEQAELFLPLARTPGRGRPRRGWFHELIDAGEVDAAGYGAHLAAVARRGVDRGWALRTLTTAWNIGCRNAMLADTYASMIVTDRTSNDRQHLRDALEICVTALDAQGKQRGRVFDDLKSRKLRLEERIAAPVRRKPVSSRNLRPPRVGRFTLDA